MIISQYIFNLFTNLTQNTATMYLNQDMKINPKKGEKAL